MRKLNANYFVIVLGELELGLLILVVPDDNIGGITSLSCRFR